MKRHMHGTCAFATHFDEINPSGLPAPSGWTTAVAAGSGLALPAPGPAVQQTPGPIDGLLLPGQAAPGDPDLRIGRTGVGIGPGRTADHCAFGRVRRHTYEGTRRVGGERGVGCLRPDRACCQQSGGCTGGQEGVKAESHAVTPVRRNSRAQRSSPWSSSPCLANSTIRIAFFSLRVRALSRWGEFQIGGTGATKGEEAPGHRLMTYLSPGAALVNTR